MHKRGREAARPQKRKMEAVAPRVEMRMTVVTWSLSIRLPRITWPKTEVVL